MFSDCCSGIPETAYARNLAAVNAVVARLDPPPEFIAFPGDAVMGSTKDYAILRAQWDFWYGTEMKWLRDREIPLFQSTSNHHTYDEGSEQVFREVHDHLPMNGPPSQRGLTYYVRRGDLLYISTHQPNQKHPIDHAWLDNVLKTHADAQFKFVAGHYPVFPVNGYITYPVWCFSPAQRKPFWDLLVKHHVIAYLTSHIIAFDVQVHENVLQILSGGAGTVGFMPAQSEYYHAVQIAVDRAGLRYQVFDTEGQVREGLSWPFDLPPVAEWQLLNNQNIYKCIYTVALKKNILVFHVSGSSGDLTRGSGDQTLMCGMNTDEGLEPVWMGIEGDSGRLIVRLVPVSGGGWQVWRGDLLTENAPFEFQIALHSGMGPGGVLYRLKKDDPWTSMESTSSKGIEDLPTVRNWSLGHGQSGSGDRAFRGHHLNVRLGHCPLPQAT